MQRKSRSENFNPKATTWLTFFSPLIIIGFVLTFLGFIFPGWLWLLNTPGDSEMLTLMTATAGGIVGVVVMVIGFVLIGLERAQKK